MLLWSPMMVSLLACSGGVTLGDAHVHGHRTGVFEKVGHVSCTYGETLRLNLSDKTDSFTSYTIALPPPPDVTRSPVFGTLERALVEGPAEFARQVPVYATVSLGDAIEGETANGVVVYIHQLVVPRSGDLHGRLDATVVGCTR